MKQIKVTCPAKINLTLEIVNKREDGFHNIKSIMQMINLYDYLDIELKESNETQIILTGNSKEIPYNESNLVYKAAKLFLEKINKKAQINIYIDKHIPVSAGLAGGSTDAAGTIFGLNELFARPLDKEDLHEICAKLGSDLNVCLEGGTILATSRGEKIEKLPSISSDVTLIKPKHLGISAKEAYTKYANKEIKPKYNMTEKMIEAINNNKNIKEFLYNDLEYAVFNDYEELQKIKKTIPNSIMSGSGSTYFVLENMKEIPLNTDYEIIHNLKFINHGIKCNNFVTN